jgi:hypothetical protein
MHPVSITLFWFYLVAVLVMILYYRFVSKPGTNNPFEDFLDSQSFGIRFFMICIGLAIKLYWGTVEKHLRSIAPYVAMASEGGATAARSVLIRTPSHPIVGLIYGSSRRQPLLGLVTISAVLSEVLVITLNTVPFSTSTAYLAFELSVYISTGIIALMITTIPLILIWQIRVKRKTVGKAPERIAEVVAMLDDDLRGTFGDLRETRLLEAGNADTHWKDKANLAIIAEELWRIIPIKEGFRVTRGRRIAEDSSIDLSETPLEYTWVRGRVGFRRATMGEVVGLGRLSLGHVGLRRSQTVASKAE